MVEYYVLYLAALLLYCYYCHQHIPCLILDGKNLKLFQFYNRQNNFSSTLIRPVFKLALFDNLLPLFHKLACLLSPLNKLSSIKPCVGNKPLALSKRGY
jgi:hypothetical protein